MHRLAFLLAVVLVGGCGHATRSASEIHLSNQVARAQAILEGYCVDGQGDAPAAVAALTRIAREHPDATSAGESMETVLADAATAIDCDSQLASRLDRLRESL
jgi:hypothetical protein